MRIKLAYLQKENYQQSLFNIYIFLIGLLGMFKVMSEIRSYET